MRKLATLWIVTFFLIIGCFTTIEIHRLSTLPEMTDASYETYLYTSGEGRQYRFSFLKSPQTNVEIVPYSVQIIHVRGTMSEAFNFMGYAPGGSSFRRVVMERVDYRDETIGYLIRFARHPFDRVYIEPHIFARDGKIFLSANEPHSIPE